MTIFFLASMSINVIIITVLSFDIINYMKSVDQNLAELNKDVKETIKHTQDKNIEILKQLKENIGG